MADSSKMVMQEGRLNARSALVKAFEQWTTPYDIKPDGVFGFSATIRSGGVTITTVGDNALDVDGRIPFDDDMEANEAEISVYNLSDSTIKQLKKGAALSVEAGYTGDTGVVFSGYISDVKTKYQNTDKITTIKALDDIKEHTLESMSFAAGTKASYILRTLINKTGIPVAVFKVRRDHTYKDAQTVDGDLMGNIKKYAEVCGISVYVSRGKIYARYIKEGDNLNFSVSSDTGMIGYPSAYTEEVTAEDFTETVNGYEVEMILQHRICAGAIVALKSKIATGQYRVCSGVHKFSNYEATTKIKMY